MVSPILELLIFSLLALIAVLLWRILNQFIYYTHQMSNGFLSLCTEVQKMRNDVTIHARMLAAARHRDGMYGLPPDTSEIPEANEEWFKRAKRKDP